MRIVIDAQNAAVFQPDPRRALNLREQHIDLIVQIADFQMPAVERAVLDLTAIVIRHDLAAAQAPADEHALAGKRIAEPAAAGSNQIGRPAIERRRELAGRHPRSGDDRLVITGEKTGGVAQPVDPNRAKIILEELPGAVLVERNGIARAGANILQRGGNRSQFAGAARFGFERAATGQVSGKGGGVIVVGPAVDVRPFDRFVLRIGKCDRLFAAGGTGRGAEPRQQNDQRKTAKIPAPTIQAPTIRAPRIRARLGADGSRIAGLTLRLRWRPLSSSDRARRYRA